jgi:hypothetical protein
MGGIGSGGKRNNSGPKPQDGTKYERKKQKLAQAAAKGCHDILDMLRIPQREELAAPMVESMNHPAESEIREHNSSIDTNLEFEADDPEIDEAETQDLASAIQNLPRYAEFENDSEDEMEEFLEDIFDIDEDDMDEANESRNISGVHARTLMDARKSIQEEIEIKRSNANANTPILDEIKRGQCWIKAPMGTANILRNDDFDPSNMCIPDIFIFIPSITFPGIALKCIHGCVDVQIHENGWQEHLGRRVYSLGSPYYIISKEYRCNVCGKRWAGYHSEAVSLLPDYCQNYFPAFLTHRAAIDKSLFYFLRSLMLNGIGPVTLSKSLNENSKRKYHVDEISYYDASVVSSSRVSHYFRERNEIPKFPAFDDKELYSGRSISGKWISNLFVRHNQSIRPYLDKVMSLRPCKMLSIDHSYKVVKRINYKGVKVFNSLFTAVNEFGEIRLQSFCLTKSLSEMNEQFMKMKQTLERTSELGLKYVYTDSCCSDRMELLNVFDSLRTTSNNSNEPLSLQFYELPPSMQIIVIQTQSHLRTICNNILLEKRDSFIAIDAEWNFSAGRGPGKVALLQIYTGDENVYLCRMNKIGNLPNSFIELLKCEEIKKVGVRVTSDIKKVLRDFNVDYEENYNGVIELGTCARKKGLIDDARISLANLCRIILKKDLDKSTRFSNWESQELSDVQKKYASSDVLVSYQIFNKLIYNGFERMKKAPAKKMIGKKVSLLNSSGLQYDVVMAEAEIIEIAKNACKVKLCKILKPNGIIGKNSSIVLSSEDSIGKVTWIEFCNMSFKLDSSSPDLLFSVSNEAPEEKYVQSDSAQLNRQRVLLDVFHVLHRIKFKKNHFRKAFFESFRNALLECNENDLENVKEVLRRKGISEQRIVTLISKWGSYFQKRIRRTVPKPETLVARLEQVFHLYSDKIDRKGRPLFSASNKSDFRKIIDHARRGCLSDPADIELYVEKKRDADGLKIYQCSRGTSLVESYHQKLIDHFSSFNAGPIFADAVLSELRHRLSSIAAINRRGLFNPGHFDQYLIEKIQILTKRLYGTSQYQFWPSSLEWSDSSEGFGLVRLPECTESFGIANGNLPKSLIKLPENVNLSRELSYLAKKMDLQIPPLQFHTKEEYSLYHQSRLQGLNDTEIVVRFAEQSNGTSIFPKLLETIKNFSKIYEDYVNTCILLESNALDIAFITNIDSEDENVSSDVEDEDIEDEDDEENKVEEENEAEEGLDASFDEEIDSEEFFTANSNYESQEQKESFGDGTDNNDNDIRNLRDINEPIQLVQGVQDPLSALIIPVQMSNPTASLSESHKRRVKHCQADKRTEEQIEAHRGIKYVCGKTSCRGMKNHQRCLTPVEEYVERRLLKTAAHQTNVQPNPRQRNERRCGARDPENPSNICHSTTCRGRGNRSLCPKYGNRSQELDNV